MTRDHTRAILYLSRLCKHWGGELVLLSDADYVVLQSNFDGFHRVDGITESPGGHHAIDYANWRVFAAEQHANPGTIIHEMGHVFLKEGRPSITDELDWLGWEVVLARRSGCYKVWNHQNGDYVVHTVPDGLQTDWRMLSHRERRDLIDERIYWAMCIGVLSQDGVPLRTRPKVISGDPR